MADRALFRHYLAELTSVAAQGDAREESFYAPLADLVLGWAGATKVEGVHRAGVHALGAERAPGAVARRSTGLW